MKDYDLFAAWSCALIAGGCWLGRHTHVWASAWLASSLIYLASYWWKARKARRAALSDPKETSRG